MEALPSYQAFVCLRESPFSVAVCTQASLHNFLVQQIYLDRELIPHILTAQGDLRFGSATLPSESSIQRSLLSIGPRWVSMPEPKIFLSMFSSSSSYNPTSRFTRRRLKSTFIGTHCWRCGGCADLNTEPLYPPIITISPVRFSKAFSRYELTGLGTLRFAWFASKLDNFLMSLGSVDDSSFVILSELLLSFCALLASKGNFASL